MRILFVTKRNETYGFKTMTRRSSGLFNSTRFIVEGLQARGVHAHIVEVIDNNCIDREVTAFKPDIVIIEALWVVPPKFDVLKNLHKKVKWFCHLHSHMPFLALEGNALEWIYEYSQRGIGLIANSPESYDALRAVLTEAELIYLPNVYISKPLPFKHYIPKKHIDVVCFGAMRPLKNHLLQALAAIEFAEGKGKLVNFHVNATRIETGGDPVLKNLRSLFRHSDHNLVEWAWHEPEDLPGILSNMAIGMQVSLTETFNVVSADYVTAGIPVVASKEVKWLSDCNKAKDDEIKDIVKVMNTVYNSAALVKWNQRLLRKYSQKAQQLWYDFVRGEFC